MCVCVCIYIYVCIYHILIIHSSVFGQHVASIFYFILFFYFYCILGFGVHVQSMQYSCIGTHMAVCFVCFLPFTHIWVLLGILSCRLQIETIWLPPFLFEYPLFLFPCLIAAARTFSTILNRSGEIGHPCLLPDFKGNASSFCPFSMILAVGLS